MNIFILDTDPVIAAQLQCDKHIVKMPLESAQMLSTAHRILDGTVEKRPSKSGKRLVNYWRHPLFDEVLYKNVHENHPCTTWTMTCADNYRWHYNHWIALCTEYRYRYGRDHLSIIKLREILYEAPKGILGIPSTPFPQAIPEELKNPADVVSAYRTFYQTKQHRFKMKWTKREVPDWFVQLTY
jgi:hypothetical protein